jgi:vesicular inhibitory amino acid transporter
VPSIPGSHPSVALVVLFSDTLEAVWPIFTSDQWKVVGLAM